MTASRLAAIVLCGVVAACSSQTPPTGQPTSHPTNQPTSTASGTPTPSAVATATTPPTAVPTATPTAPPPGSGLGWTAVNFPQVGDACCWQITSADAGYLILQTALDSGPVLMTSTNGTTWRPIAGLDWPGGTILRIGSWEGSFLAAGIGGHLDDPRLDIWQSPDGRSWMTLADLALPSSARTQDQLKVSAVFATEDRITVVGEIWPSPCHEGCLGPIAVRQWTSVDNGGSWHVSALPAELANHQPAISIGNVKVRVSQYWDDFESSTDGKNWHPISAPTAGDYRPTNVRLTSAGVVAVGSSDSESGLVLSSADGVNWTQSVGWPDLDRVWFVNDVAGYGSTLVATGFDVTYGFGYVLVSTPGQ